MTRTRHSGKDRGAAGGIGKTAAVTGTPRTPQTRAAGDQAAPTDTIPSDGGLLPPAVLELLRPRTRLVKDPTAPTALYEGAGDGAEVAHTRVEVHTVASPAELAAAGLTPLHEKARTATDIAYRWLLSFPSPATRRSYASDLRQFESWCAGHDVADVLGTRRSLLEAYDRHLAETISHVLPDGHRAVIKPGLKPSSRARKLAALSSFFAYGVDDGLIDGNPVGRAKRPDVSSATPDLNGLSARQLVQLLDTAEVYGTREHALVCLLALLGMRVAEAVGVDIENIGTREGHSGTHHAVTLIGKGGKTRRLALSPRAWAAVRAAAGDRVHGPLLITSSGRRMSTDQARSTMKVLARRADVGLTRHPNTGEILDVWLHPHSLRHTFVTLARQAGAALEDVQDAAGHSDPRTTRAYDIDRGQLDRSPSYDIDRLLARTPHQSEADRG